MTSPPSPVPSWRGRTRDVRYWSGQVWPRRGSLFRDKALWGALVAALAITYALHMQPVRNVRIDQIATAEIAFASLSLGACITGAVLALSIAPADRIRTWSRTGPARLEFSHYSELIFTFTWAATSQLAVVASAGISYIVGAGVAVWPSHPHLMHIGLAYLASALVVYALLHLLIVIATISTIGAVIISETVREDQ